MKHRIEKIGAPQVSAKPFSDRQSLIDGLPSNYLYYTWSGLRIRPYVVNDLITMAKFHRMAKTDKIGAMEVLISLVDSTISEDVNELTLGDFEYLLYWLRLNSYTKTPLTVTWTCPACRDRLLSKMRKTDPKAELSAKQEAELRQVQRLMKTDIEIQELTTKYDLPEGFGIARMADYLPYLKVVEDNPDAEEVARAAMYLSGGTYEERMDRLLNSMEDFEVARGLNILLSSHGATNRAVVVCGKGECGKKYPTDLDNDPYTFLL